MPRKPIRISVPGLKEIERALNAKLFQGSAIGVTINDTLIGAFETATRSWNWRDRIKDKIRYRLHRFVQPWSGMRSYESLHGKIMCTWLFDRQDLKEFLLPVLNNYGPEGAFVVAPSNLMRAKLPPQTGFVVWDDFPEIDMNAWRKAFDECEPFWRAALQDIVTRHGLPRFLVEFLLDRLQLQTQRIVAAGRFLDLAKPKAIVTEFDRNEHASCLLIAARQRGIPSITMVHSALNPNEAYGFAPVHADAVCCWGQRQVDILRKSGSDPARLTVTGCHALKQELAADGAAVKASIGIAPATPLLLLATSPINLRDRKTYALAFCMAMSRLSNAQAVVRLHPAERLSEYADLIEQFSKILFLNNTAMSRDESLAAADVVFVHDSAYGSDAVMKGKLVAVLDVLNGPLGIGQELADLAGCPVANSADALESLAREFISSPEFRDDLHEKGKRYAAQYCDSYGGEAAVKVVAVIDRAIGAASSAAALRQNC